MRYCRCDASERGAGKAARGEEGTSSCGGRSNEIREMALLCMIEVEDMYNFSLQTYSQDFEMPVVTSILFTATKTPL